MEICSQGEQGSWIEKIMSHTRRVSNININDRIKQVIILLIVILIGIFISSRVNGQPRFKREDHHDKKENNIQAKIKKDIVLKRKKY